MASVKNFARGVWTALRSLGWAAGQRQLLGTYFRVVLVFLSATLALNVAGIWGLFALTGWSEATSGWWVALDVSARIVGTAAIILAAPLISLQLVNLVFPVFNEGIFLRALAMVDEPRAEGLRQREGLSWHRALRVGLRRLWRFLLGTGMAIAAGMIPIVGPVIGTAIQLWVSARTVGWELLEPYLVRRGLDWKEQRAFLAKNRGAVLGFGLPCSLLLATPFVGPLFFGFAQTAAAGFVKDFVPAREDAVTKSGPAPR